MTPSPFSPPRPSAMALAGFTLFFAAAGVAAWFANGYYVFIIANMALTAIVGIGLNDGATLDHTRDVARLALGRQQVRLPDPVDLRTCGRCRRRDGGLTGHEAHRQRDRTAQGSSTPGRPSPRCVHQRLKTGDASRARSSSSRYPHGR